MPSTHLTRTISSTGNRQKWTLSLWIKFDRVKTGSLNIFSSNKAADGDYSTLYLDASRLTYYDYDGGTVNRLRTSRLFRDLNAWYHIVVRYDSTHGTANNRIRFYVNGSEATDIIDRLNPSQNYNSFVNANTYKVFFGAQDGDNDGTGDRFGGSMSHIHFCDGYDYDASAFGSTDSTTGEWKINTSPSVTYGTNGFFILKDGNSVTDASTNSNNFTVGGGTLTKTEDCPSNVFCTWNPLYRSARKDMTLTNGNTFIFEQNSGDSGVSGTIGVSSGKYYWEQIVAQVNGTNAAITGGLHTTEDWNESPTDAMAANTVGMRSNGNVWKGTTDLGNFTTATYNGDIIGVGFDADNGSMYFWRNGTALNSGNAIITGMDMTKTWIPFGVQHGGARVTTSTNFGNGYFQTTAVSSAGTNASGNGIFEYDVPTGYTALSTKGLNL